MIPDPAATGMDRGGKNGAINNYHKEACDYTAGVAGKCSSDSTVSLVYSHFPVAEDLVPPNLHVYQCCVVPGRKSALSVGFRAKPVMLIMHRAAVSEDLF